MDTHQPSSDCRTILLVDDEEAVMAIGKEILETSGYAVLTASTPMEAVHLAQRTPEDIHLLITDVVLPEMNGHDLAQILMQEMPELAVLFTSGYTMDVIGEYGIHPDDMHFIRKPYSIKGLLDQVHAIFEDHR